MLFTHPPSRGFNDLVVGTVLCLSGFCGIWLRSLRFFDLALGLWMAATLVVLRSGPMAVNLHDALLGLCVVGLALRGGRDAEQNLDHWVLRFDPRPDLGP